MSLRRNIRVSKRIWGSDPGPFEGNDVRIQGGVIGRCILCGARKQLRLSHVIPKWGFKWHKDAWGGVVKTQLLSRGVELVQQDGNKHYLMCENCEQIASVSEAYAYAIATQNNTELRKKGTLYLFFERYWNLRFDLISQFVAVTALRIHFAKSVPLSNTVFPIDIRKVLRSIALKGIQKRDFVVAAWRFVPPKSNPKHHPREDIYEMYEEGELGRTFILQVGGLEWMLCFDSDRIRKRIGDIDMKGKWINRIASLPYDEHRRFKYPEKWAPQIAAKIANEKTGSQHEQKRDASNL